MQAAPDEEPPAPVAEAPTVDTREEAPLHEVEPVDAAPAAPQWDEPAEEQQPAAEADAQQEHPAEDVTAAEPDPQDVSRDEAEIETHQAEPAPVEVQAEDVPDRPGPSEWALPEWEDTTPPARPSETPAEPEDHRQDETSPAEPERLGIHPVEPERRKRSSSAARPTQRAPGHSTTATPLPKEPKARRTGRPTSRKFPNGRGPSRRLRRPRTRKSVPARPGTMSMICSVLTTTGERRMVRRATRTKTAALPRRRRSLSPHFLSHHAQAQPVQHQAPVDRRGGRASPRAGGYAYWQNREAGNAWLTGMVAKLMPGDPAEAPAPATPGSEAEPANRPAEQSGIEENAALSDAASTKFTQRLLADGTEMDEGPAVANETAASQEGKSVAARTHAVEPPNANAGVQQAAADQTASPVPGQAASEAAQPEVSVADGEKMFLYEERLGQSSPTAIPGTVAWSIKEESPGGDAKPEPAIQAQITVPDRGLTALMTIKRNADPPCPQVT